MFVRLFVTPMYVLTKQFSYLFYFQRMKMIHVALKLDQKFIRFVRSLVLFLIVIGTTALFYPLAAVMFTGKVIPEGICVQFTPSIATVILFALADFGLSCLLLLLFVLPLTRFAKRQASVTGKALMWIAYQNLAVSAFVMLFTMSQLTYMTVVDVQTVQQRLEDQLGGPHITSVRRYDIILCAA